MKQNKNDLKNAKLLAAIINNNPKQKLLAILEKRGGCTVTQLAKATKWPQPVVSQHLAGLRKCNLVCAKRDGKFIFYSMWFERITLVNNWAKSASNFITTK